MNPSNRVVRTVGITAIVALMTGCAGMQEIVERQDKLRAPAPLLAARALPSITAAYRKAAHAAEEKFVESIKAGDMAGLVDAGIAASNANCRAWFAALSEADRRWTQGEGDQGIMGNLITATLGAIGAHSSAVAAYGIGATALSAYNSNFRTSILTMAQPELQAAVLRMMEARANELRGRAATLTYPRAVDALDDYARICTAANAAAITSAALQAIDPAAKP